MSVRHDYNTRLNDYLRSECRNVVSNLLSWRMTIIECPFNEGHYEEMLRRYWGAELRDMQLRLYALNPHSVLTDDATKLFFRVADHRYAITLSFGKQSPVIDSYAYRKQTHDPDLWPGMRQWLEQCTAMSEQHRQDDFVVEKLLGHVGTYGQMLRMWPDFVQYLPGADRLALARQQVRRSPLPTTFPFERDETITRYELQAKLHDINTRLAEGALLKSIHAAAYDNHTCCAPAVWPHRV